MLIGTVSTVNAVGAKDGIIPKGEKLYYDFSACKPTELNYISQVQSNNWKWDYLSKGNVPNDYILTTTIESDMDFNKPGNGSLGKACVNNQWKEPLKVTVPENGQNLIKVSADGNSYTWSTYSDSNSVAQSVSLTASPATVTSGGSTKLTATLTKKAAGVDKVTYTFTDASNKTVGTATTSDTTASIDVTPSATTTYTVSVSADNYTSVSDTATVTVKTTPKAELLYGTSGDPLNSTTSFSMTYDAESDCFYYVVDSNLYNNSFRFRFSYNGIQYGAAWKTYPESKTVNVDGDKVDVNNNVNNWDNKPGCKVGNATSKFTIWFDANNLKTWIVNAEAPKYTVTYGVNDEAIGSVKATYADSTSIGTSPASVEEGKPVTFTATPNEGYAVEGWYSDADCKNAITDARTNTSYEVTVNANTYVYVKFKSTTIDPEYRLTGDLSAIKGWKGYNSALKFDTAESDGSYSKIITVTDDDVNVNNRKYFKLIKLDNGSDKYYGPNEGTYDIISSNSSVTAYNTYENSGQGNDFFFSKPGTYKIHYIVKTDKNAPSVWVEENTTKYNVIVADSIKSIASVDKTEFAKGEKVTVTATPETGKVLDKVTVVGEDGSTPIETTVSGNNATFTMPAQNVTVKEVTFRKAKTCTVTFRSSDNNFGTVSAIHNRADFTSGATVTEGDTVTFTAEPSEGYKFIGWKVNDESETRTEPSLPLTITADTTVVANFKEMTGTLSKYYLLCGTDQTFQTGNYTSFHLYEDGNGAYYADFDLVQNSIPTGKDYFIIFSTNENTSGIIESGDASNIKINQDNNGKGFSITDYGQNVSRSNASDNYVRFAKVYIDKDNKDEVSGFTIKINNLDLNNKTITYSAEPKFKETPKNAVNIFAKNGTIATNGTQDYGVTKVTSGVIDPTGSEKAGYTKYMAVKGSIITVQTTVNEDYKKEGYYVYAYCVNGKTVPAQKTEPGVYSASYTIDGTNTDIEITPVYFNTNIEEAGDYITFYVNADELEGKWGDTVALYTYYYKSDEVNNNNAFSATAYPGQPMLQNKDGLFYIKVPKYYYANGKKQYGYNNDANKPYSVSGMTINNYGLEGLHKTLKGAKDADGTVANRQSYDYKDFAVLAEQGYDTIMFDVKYRKGTSNQSSLLADAKDAPVMTDPKIDILTYGNKTHNGWDDFINYFSGNKTDVLGYDLDPTQDKKLYVVSTGNQKTTVGVWSTEWYVFDQDGKFIVQGNPNDFILTDKDVAEGSTNEIWNALKHYKGAVTKICYESEMNAKTSHEEGNDGIRVDGRWYYTKADDVKVTLKTRVEYSTDHGTTFFKDENTNPENTGFIGKETGVKAAINDVTSCEFPLNATNAVLTASSSSLWLFKGWYVYVKDADGNYNYIEYDKDAMSKIELVTGAYTEFVARYIKIGSGQLVLSHTAYDGPDKLGGRGTYYIQVDLTGKDGKTTTYDYTTGSITIPIAQSDQPISIKLKTVCAGNNTFYRFYEKDKNGKYLPFGGEGDSDVGKPETVEHSFTVKPSDLFDSSGHQVTMALNYYSDISPVTGDAVLNYRYKNRFDQDRVYTVKVKLDDTYYDYTKQAYIIDSTIEKHKKLIMDNAPAIDDLHKDCLWSITQQTTTINGTYVVLDGIQTDKEFNVKLSYCSDDAINETDFALTYIGQHALNSYIKNSETGDFYKTAAEVNGKKFLYWSVSVVSDNTKREIARCYSQYFNLRVTDNFIVTPVYSGTRESYISIGNATYTREQYTEAGINYDYLYADFIVAFMSPDAELLNQSSKYKTGVIVELNQNAKVTENDVNSGTFGAVGSTVNYSGIKFNSSSVEIQKLATGNSPSVKYKNAENVSNIAYKFEINNSGYNNKNRLDYYVKFKNTQAYRNYVMKAYYYVYEVNANGNAVESTFKITDAVYFNLYDIGNSETKK